jgi:hypothetical protein
VPEQDGPSIPDGGDHDDALVEGGDDRVGARRGPSRFAQAAPPTFRITQVFVSPNGYSQFVELTEWAGQDGQNGFRGLTLTMTGTQGVRTMDVRRRPPDDQDGPHVGDRRVVTATRSTGLFHGSGGIAYYDGLGAGFIDPNGGTLDFAGVDTFPLRPVPLDGVNAV